MPSKIHFRAHIAHIVSHKDTSLLQPYHAPQFFQLTASIKENCPPPFADPNSTHNSPIAIFPGLPTAGPTLPLPSTQLKLPVSDLLFLSMEPTALKGSSLLAADVQGSWAHQECSLYDARRGMCHINSGTRGGHQPVCTLLRCH